MKSMSCKQFDRLSQDMLDDELDAARISAVRGHLRTCLSCAQRFAETEALVESARELEALDPPPSLWDGIDARLAAEEVADSRRSPFWFWWQQVRRPATVGGLIAATAGAAFVLATLTHPTVSDDVPGKLPGELAVAAADDSVEPMSDSLQAASALESIESDYQNAIDELFVLVEDERSRWSPAALGVFQERMRSINDTLRLEGQRARLQPDNPVVHDALHGGYRDKLALLQQAVLAHDEWQ